MKLGLGKLEKKPPSYPILESLAYKYLNVTLAVFLFPQPPDLEDPVRKFRRLPDYEMQRLSSDTFKIIRLSQVYQDSLVELSGLTNVGRKIFNEFDIRQTETRNAVDLVREYLGITFKQQFEFEEQKLLLRLGDTL
jgi:hypothetical protein